MLLAVKGYESEWVIDMDIAMQQRPVTGDRLVDAILAGWHGWRECWHVLEELL